MFSRFNLAAMARLKPGIPSTAVYLVKPSWMAWMAAALIGSGVSKSGSPAARLMIALPAALSAAARAETLKVGEGLIFKAQIKNGGVLYLNLSFSRTPHEQASRA